MIVALSIKHARVAMEALIEQRDIEEDGIDDVGDEDKPAIEQSVRDLNAVIDAIAAQLPPKGMD